MSVWVVIAITVFTYPDLTYSFRLWLFFIISGTFFILTLATNYIFLPAPTLVLEPLSLTKGGKLKPSQFIGMSWAKVGSYSYEIHADFGVIHVRARHGHFLGCKAEVRIRTRINQSDAKTGITTDLWRPMGHLNWYSESLKQNLAQIADFDFWKLNSYLTNTSVDINRDDESDLLLCYTIPLSRSGNERYVGKVAYICSDVATSSIGMFNEQPLEFRAEVTVIAQQQEKIVRNFDVNVATDTITISSVTN